MSKGGSRQTRVRAAGTGKEEGNVLRLGLLGGTFDPIHLGHLRTAEEVGEALDLDKVYLIPAAVPPHKTREPITAFAHRYAMVRLGISTSPRLGALDLEGKRPGPSYSIETLRGCQAMFGPLAEIFFILGMDAFLEIYTWKAYLELFDWAHFVVIGREGSELEKPAAFLRSLGIAGVSENGQGFFTSDSGKSIHFLQTTRMDISASRIRLLCREGKSLRFLIPEPVREYIEKTGLYRNHGHA